MEPTQAVPPESLPDFSLLGLFLQADPIVKGVMILLVIASLACWTIVFDRASRVAVARRQARAFTAAARGGDLEGAHGPIARRVVEAAVEAWRDRDETESRAERRERIERAMRVALGIETRRLRAGLPLLATCGSTAPFVGLFGTVWGIMNAFSSIARSQDTSLAVVAPGIAEALLATAVGLAVAIPAVMAYNKLTGDVGAVQGAFTSGIALLGDRLARDRDGQPRAAAE